MIKLRQGNDEKEIEVIALSDQRRGAPEAQLLYQETAQSVKKREEMAWARKNNALSMPHPDRRPNKKERRDLLKFKHQDEFLENKSAVNFDRTLRINDFYDLYCIRFYRYKPLQLPKIKKEK